MSWATFASVGKPETDEQLRDRLLDIIDGARQRDRIMSASSSQLEHIAREYKLRRRTAHEVECMTWHKFPE